MIYAPYSKTEDLYFFGNGKKNIVMTISMNAIKITYSLKRRDEGTLFDLTLKKESGSWILSGTKSTGCICSDDEVVNLKIKESAVVTLFEELSRINVAPLVLHNNSIEEGFEVVTITNGIFHSRFSWDERVPSDYEKLQKIGRVLQGWLK